jgi:hypothetical protein
MGERNGLNQAPNGGLRDNELDRVAQADAEAALEGHTSHGALHEVGNIVNVGVAPQLLPGKVHPSSSLNVTSDRPLYIWPTKRNRLVGIGLQHGGSE